MRAATGTCHDSPLVKQKKSELSQSKYGSHPSWSRFDRRSDVAVFETDGKEYVYLASGGRAVKTEVETEYKTAARAVIAGGLQEGSEVIREADAEGVFDGARIRVRR